MIRPSRRLLLNGWAIWVLPDLVNSPVSQASVPTRWPRATKVSLSRVRKRAGREVFVDAQSLIFCAADSAWEDPDSTSRHSSRIAA
jgi:hypothetical protein